MDTNFAKIVTDLDGRDHILIEGRIVTLDVDDTFENNRFVDAIVRGLRSGGEDRTSWGSQAVSKSILGDAPADASD